MSGRIFLRAWLSALVVTCIASSALAQPPENAEPAEADAPAEGDAEEAPAEEAPEEAAEEAPAQPPGLVEARERVARAERLFEEGNYDAALVEFKETLELLGDHPVRFQVVYNIAKTLEQLYRYDQAMEYYRLFLEEGGAETELAPQVDAKLELLQGLLGTIRITVNVADYEVWVDDHLIGTNRDEVLVPSGTHVVEVRAPGHVASRQEVQVPARAERSVEFELEELAEEFEGLPRSLFWATAAGAVALAAGGAVFGVLAIQRRNEIDEQFDAELGGLGVVGPEDREDVQRLSRNADILFGSALLVATAAVIFAVFMEDGDEESPEVDGTTELRLSPAVGRDSAGLFLGGRF